MIVKGTDPAATSWVDCRPSSQPFAAGVLLSSLTHPYLPAYHDQRVPERQAFVPPRLGHLKAGRTRSSHLSCLERHLLQHHRLNA